MSTPKSGRGSRGIMIISLHTDHEGTPHRGLQGVVAEEGVATLEEYPSGLCTPSNKWEVL